MTHPDSTRRPAETPPAVPLRHRVLGLLDFTSTLVLAMVDAMLAHTKHTPRGQPARQHPQVALRTLHRSEPAPQVQQSLGA